MIGRSSGQSRSRRPSGDRKARPGVEGLESRLLLYATLGAGWTYGSRITFSLVPDGTSIGGTPSTLFQSLNNLFPTSTWQLQFQKAAAVWQQIANVNLVWIADQGGSLGTSGAQQGDSRFGDIRISAIPLADGALGAAFSPPPINGGTAAGDIVLNSTTIWRINSNFDLETVAIHEFGHALGMNHSQITTAVMYAYYNGIKQNLTSDDVSGIQSVYGPRQYDPFNSGATRNYTASQAVSLDWALANNRITITNLDITTPGQAEWFWVTIPAVNSGFFTAIAQSYNLSLLSPRIQVYDASLNPVGDWTHSASSNFGDVVMVPVTGVHASDPGYFIKVSGYSAVGGGPAVGGYALQIYFSNQALTLVSPPNTTVGQKTDQGGGLMTMTEEGTSHHELVQIGNFRGWGDDLTLPGYGDHDEQPRGGSLGPVPRSTAWGRYMVGPTFDPTLATPPWRQSILVAAKHAAARSPVQAIVRVDRTLVHWTPGEGSTMSVGRVRPRRASTI
jgi:hypothetical protein